MAMRNKEQHTTGNRLKLFLRAMRIHQWVKNLLLFVPLVMAHQVSNRALLLKTTIGFLSFSFCASSVYILNDILDLKADRDHPTKRDRPFAAGELVTAHGLILVPLLLFPGFGIAALLSLKFLAVLSLYYLLTLGYSLYFKRIALLDVSVLALLYTIRLFAGSALTEVVISQWLLAFSMFLFFSLSMVKRSSELYNATQRNLSQPAGRGYVVTDREQLATLGTASGYCAVLVFTLYINSSAVLNLYTHPMRLWLVCPLIFYWISRIWLLAHRGEVNEDPIVFAMKDKLSYVIGALVAISFLSAL
jgi:4-hydroxybenzoate polyprenyltransferase